MGKQNADALIRSGIFFLIFLFTYAFATDPPLNMSMRSHYDKSGETWADVWGDGNFLYIGHYFQPRVTILDISDPDNIKVAKVYNVPSPNNDCSAQEVAVYDGLMFIGLEYNGKDAIEIVDVRDPYNPKHLTWVVETDYAFEEAHNLFYDPVNKFLYQANSRDSHVAIYDLRDYNPDDPPAKISDAFYILHTDHDRNTRHGLSKGGRADIFVHDITVLDGILYVANWDLGVLLYDVSKFPEEEPRFLGEAPGNNTHSVWPTPDKKFIVTAEERQGGGILLFEVVPDGAGGVNLIKRDEYTLSLSKSYCAHDPLIVDYRVYTAWYQAGVLVHDINPDTKKFELVASYDTSDAGTGGYDGCWGVYPFLGKKKILAGDIQTGAWVLSDDAPWAKKIKPSAVSIVSGQYVSGSLWDLFESEGKTYDVKAYPYNSGNSSFYTCTEFDFSLEGDYVSSLGVTVVSKDSVTPATQEIQIFDVIEGKWITVDKQRCGTDFMTVSTGDLKEPLRFVNPGDYVVRVRVIMRWNSVGTLLDEKMSEYDMVRLDVVYQ
ncbi:MAG TPA: hypothetical protein VNK96_09275 [Fimbriimonadales bacterium]|nr:hypothetical protein [Fimbriimonadales bacterium]